ncbi:MAG: hypothetical protein B6A08_08100 [Sorangiineae bacterium NIC37A_2]|nr:MAG: hypothetical protein B6A08_08100 [Sorangiineae bacterium NIC37A_2]
MASLFSVKPFAFLKTALALSLLVLSPLGCGESTPGDGSGGALPTGGTGTESGGAPASGGMPGAGGTPTASGGEPGSGGLSSGGSAAGGAGLGGAPAAGGQAPGDGGSASGGEGTGGSPAEPEWLPIWATTMQSLETNKADHVPPTLPNNTLRQFVWPTVSGGKVRLRLSNVKGQTPVDIQKVHIARAKNQTDPQANVGQIDASTSTALTFNGAPNVTIPAGMAVFSDGVDFTLEELKLTAITIQFGANIPANITNHPGSRLTSYFASGDAVAQEAFNGAQTRDRWYFIDALEVMAPADAVAIAVLGDSITDGYGVLNKFARWTDVFSAQLKKDAALASKRSVLNFGMGANMLASDSEFQDAGVKRFERDVLSRSKIKYLIVLEGVNDIEGGAQAQTLTSAYQDIITRATAQGIKVFVSPLTPMNAANAVRTQVNEWIRASEAYSEGVDFDLAIRDPGNPNNMQAPYKNDNLHPSEAGYKAMGESVAVTLFHD